MVLRLGDTETETESVRDTKIQMEDHEDPVELCRLWAQHAAPALSPPRLAALALANVKTLIRTYPTVSGDEEKSKLMQGIRNLFDVPLQFVPDFLNSVLDSMQVQHIHSKYF